MRRLTQIIIGSLIIMSVCLYASCNSSAAELFNESFVGAENAVGKSITEWNEWTAANYAAASAEGTTITVEQDPSDSTNFVMKLVRTQIGSSKVLLEASHEANFFTKGYVNYTLRFMPMQESFSMKMLPLVSDIRHDRITCYNGSQMKYSDTEKGYIKVGEWNTLRLRLSNENSEVELYINENKVGSAMSLSAVPSLGSVSVRMDRNRAPGTVYIDDIRVETEEDPACIKGFTFSLFSNSQKEQYVTQNLSLNDTVTVEGEELGVVWTSDDTTVIAADGTVVRGDYNKNVTLTADITVKSTGSKYIKEFNILVPGKGEVILHEDFDEAQAGQPVATSTTEGYNGWVLDSDNYNKALAENTTTTIEKDPDDENNLAVKIYRENAGTDNKVNINLRAGQNLQLGEVGLLSYNLKFRFYSGSPEFIIKPFINNFASSSVTLNSISGKKTLNKSYNDGKWHDLNILFDYYKLTFDMYIDGEKAIDTVQYESLPSSFNFFSLAQQRSKTGTVYIDDILISILDIGDANSVNEVAEALVLEEEYTEDFVLKPDGDLNTKIEWMSLNPDVINIQGLIASVCRYDDEDKEVQIKAVITRGNASTEKLFTVTVPKMTEIETALQSFNFDYIGQGQEENFVTENLNMPEVYETPNGRATVIWTSSSECVQTDGTVERGDYDEKVTVSAQITLGTESITKNFEIVVAAAGSICGYENFEAVQAENTGVEALKGWSVNAPSADESVYNTVVKDILSTQDFLQANKVMKIERYINKGSGNPSVQDAVFKLPVAVSGERTAYDFDMMLLNEASRLWIRIGDINKLFIVDKDSVQRNGFSSTDCAFNESWKIYDWHHVSIVLDSFNGCYDVFADYEKINDAPIFMPGLGNVTSISFYSDRISAFNDSVLIDNVRVRNITVADDVSVERAAEALTLGGIDYSSARIILPTLGECNTKIEWTSSHDAIGADGIVSRSIGADTQVTLTAIIKKGAAQTEKTFDIAVEGLSSFETPTQEVLEVVAQNINAELITDEKWNYITNNLNLPTSYMRGMASDIGGISIEWKSSNPSVINEKGEVVAPRYDMRVELTAKIISKTDRNVWIEKTIPLVAAMNSTIIREYTFDDIAQEYYGENISVWSDFVNKSAGANMEYGVSHFADKTEFGKANADANKALYIHRYFTSSMGTVRQDLYTSITAVDNLEMKGNLAVDMRVKPTENRLRVMLEGIIGNNIYITDSYLELRNIEEPYYYSDYGIDGRDWYNFTFFIDYDSRRMNVYADNIKLNTEPIDIPNAQGHISRIRFYNDDNIGSIILDDIRIRALTDSDLERVNRDAELLMLDSIYTSDINLPTTGRNGSRIYWTSSNESIVSQSGKVYPSPNSEATVTLKALIICGNQSAEKSFNVTVPRPNSSQINYEITDISVNGRKIKAHISSYTSKPGYAIFIIYDKGKLMEIKKSPVSMGETECEFDSTNVIYGNIKVFILSDDGENDLLSNIKECSFTN